MLKTSSDIAIRIVVLASVSFPGVPVFAAVPAASLSVTGTRLQDEMPELAPVLAALDGIGGRQTVSNPGRDPGRDRGRDANTSHDGADRGRSHRLIQLNRITTQKIVLDLESIRRECGNYDPVYRIDCLRQGIDMIVATLPSNGEYRDAKRTLQKASNRLRRIVRTYEDRSAAKLEAPANANPRFRKSRKYTAIRRAAVPEAMNRAQRVIDEATTELLRSGENSERRYVHYQDVSFALDSTKVLLRSS